MIATTTSVVHGHHQAAALARRSTVATGPGGPVGPQGLTGESHVLFRSTALNHDFGRLAIAPLADPNGPRAVSSLKCDRVDFAGGRGMCLTGPSAGPISSATVAVFDAHFATLHRVSVVGIPSRVRVSPDGHYGAATGFVSGDSYATIGFSTRTDIVDDQAGWLDNDTAIYGIPDNASEVASLSAVAPGPPVLGGDSSIATGTWTVPADGGGGAKKLIAGSWSTVITRS